MKIPHRFIGNYIFDSRAREAGGSIKPGVERSGTPGHRSIKNKEPAKRATEVAMAKRTIPMGCRPLRGLGHSFCIRSRGLRPGLYAIARSARFPQSLLRP